MLSVVADHCWPSRVKPAIVTAHGKLNTGCGSPVFTDRQTVHGHSAEEWIVINYCDVEPLLSDDIPKA